MQAVEERFRELAATLGIPPEAPLVHIQTLEPFNDGSTTALVWEGGETTRIGLSFMDQARKPLFDGRHLDLTGVRVVGIPPSRDGETGPPLLVVGSKLVLIWRIQLRQPGSPFAGEHWWTPDGKVRESVIAVDAVDSSLDGQGLQALLLKAWRGVEILRQMEAPDAGGRPPGKSRPDPGFPDRFNRALRARYDGGGDGQTERPSQEQVAWDIGESVDTLQRRIKDGVVPWPPLWPPE